jgi:sporulation protein YlmC with PRC-barrel domain
MTATPSAPSDKGDAEATGQAEATVLAASTLVGDKVKNPKGEDLGKIEELMIDLQSGRVAYAVISFGAGFMRSGKLFAIPWRSLTVDQTEKQIILNVTREMLETAEGFDKDNWPDLADPAFRSRTYVHYGIEPW